MIKINGEDVEREEILLLDYLKEQNYNMKIIVVECNEEIVPRDQYGTFMLHSGDVVEIVSLWEEAEMKKNPKFPTEQEILESLELRHTKPVQEKLGKARVAVCGLGGLGSAIAMPLPGAVWGICT